MLGSISLSASPLLILRYYMGLIHLGWVVFVRRWETFAQDIINGAGLKPNAAPRLWLASFAGSSHGSGFSPQSLYSAGIISGPLGQYIDTYVSLYSFRFIICLLKREGSSVSQHHYSGSFCTGSGGLLSDLMAKAGVRGNISQFSSDISASVAQGLTYVFGETNSYACHGAPGEYLLLLLGSAACISLILNALAHWQAFRIRRARRSGRLIMRCKLR